MRSIENDILELFDRVKAPEKTGKSKSEIFRSGLQALYREEMDFE